MNNFTNMYNKLNENEESIRFLKLKYLMNIYYAKAKSYKYTKIFTTFLAPLIIVIFNYILKNKDINIAIQFFSSSILFIIYIYSDYELMKYKSKAAYVHEELDSTVFGFRIKKFNKYAEFIETEIKKLSIEDMYLENINHYDDSDKGLSLISGRIDGKSEKIRTYTDYNNEIIRNIQKSNLLASIKTRNLYIKFNVFILILIYIIILINIYIFEYKKIDEIVYNGVDSIILLIPISIVIINESMNLLREKEKIINALEENKTIEKNTNISLQEFIYELRAEYTEIPTFIYEYSYSEKQIKPALEAVLNVFRFISICICGILSNIWEFVYRVLIIPICKILKKIMGKMLIKSSNRGNFTKLNYIYIRCLYLCSFMTYKRISWEQKYYNIWGKEVLRYLDWKSVDSALINQFQSESIIVGSFDNETVLDLDLDVQIKVLEKEDISKVLDEIKKRFQQKGNFEKEIKNKEDNCIDVVFNSNRNWKIDIRITSDYKYIGKSDINNINHKKYARKIIFIKKLVKAEIIPMIPSAYIYYIVINKNKSVFKSIRSLFEYWEIYRENPNFNNINTFIKFCDRE